MSNTRKLKPKFLINLQLFGNPLNDPDFQNQVMQMLEGNEQAQPQVEQPTQQPQQTQEPPQQNTQQDGGQGTEEPPQQQQAQPNQEPQEGQPTEQAPNNGLILGKFKTPEELVNAYQQLEAFNTKTRQELAQTKQDLEQMAANTQQNNIQQKDNNSITQPNDPEAENEEFMNKFYENPKAALAELMQAHLNPIQQRIQAEDQQKMWNDKVANFAATTPDFEQFKPVMQQILDKMPELGDHPEGLTVVYNMAKGQNYQDPNKIATEMLNNEDFVNQNIMGNEAIKQKVIEDYLKNVKQGSETPITISNQNGGSMPITPENRPANMEEAAEMARRLFQGE